MKKTISAAIIIAATVVLFSCDWFSGKKEKSPTIIGNWQVDSIYPIGKDSNSLALMLYALANKGKDSSIIQFNADSTFRELSGKDSVGKKYYVKDQTLFVQDDSAYVSYQLSFVQESTVNLLSKDSLVIVLKKK